MTLDMVDMLHEAEDRVGRLEHVVERVVLFAADHPWTGLGDAHGYEGYETLLAELRAAHEAKYERPGCDEDCDDEFCGSPRHVNQEWNDATGEWEDDASIPPADDEEQPYPEWTERSPEHDGDRYEFAVEQEDTE